MKFLHILFYVFALLFFLSCTTSGKPEKVNILFIAVDDLRPELGIYGQSQIKSPNIDKLAAEALVFKRAYCQQAICMASRASIMSGFRPDTLHIYNTKSLNELAPDVLTLNRHFENSGYKVWASGKIYHHEIDHKLQFGENYFTPETGEKGRGYLTEASWKIMDETERWYQLNRKTDAGGRGPAYECADVPDNAYRDGKMTDMALAKMADFKNEEKPFFMAVGFHKPHLPFNAPKKYWDLYDESLIELSKNPFNPKNASTYFNYNFGELRNYPGIPKDDELLGDSISRILKHGYYACVSYTDAQIGRLIDGLKENGLYDNTVIIIWGDHGWKLGEHGMWCKHTQFEIDNHVPLIVKAPRQKTGLWTDGFVEFVDIYPSLCEMAGLKVPAHVQGTSFVPLFENPGKQWKKAAFSYYPMGRINPEEVVIGYTIKTDRYRYTEWIKNSTNELLAIDLFDHQTDPDENYGIASNPENAQIIKELSLLLNKGKGWREIAANLN